MVAETLTGRRAARTYPVQGVGGGAQPVTVWGGYTIAAAVEVGDIFEICRTPDRFLCIGGQLVAGDMDTNGTETLDMDLGWAANGAGTVNYIAPWGATYANAGSAADPDGFLNTGVWVGDAITDLMPVAGIFRPIVLPVPLFFNKATIIQLEAIAVAATFAAGSVNVELRGFII